jgi:hypothetical protein
MTNDRDKFIEYVTGLATETGETALLLRQKPRLVEGALVYHSDGARESDVPGVFAAKSKD